MGFISSLIPSLGGSNDEEEKRRSARSGMERRSSSEMMGNRKRNHRGTTPDGLGDKQRAKDIKFTDETVHFSVQGTSNSMNVTRENLRKQFTKDRNRISEGVSEVMKALPEGEAQEVKNDIVKAEHSNQKRLLKSNIGGKEKLLLAARILEENAEKISEATDKLFEINAETSDTSYREKKPELQEIYTDVQDRVDSTIILYRFVKEKARKNGSAVEKLALEATNLYKNSIKAFSAQSKDAGHNIELLEEKVGGKEVSDAGKGPTIFENYFNEPLR